MSRTILIPAAGMGLRSGHPEAKEMLSRPQGVQFSGEPMISMALAIAREVNATAHVISREEKTNLNEFLAKMKQAQIQTVKVTREWPETILLSYDYWSEFNVLCLPDVDFAPYSVVGDMFQDLESGADVVFATFKAKNYKEWGVVEKTGELGSAKTQTFNHCEKPLKWGPKALAWGLIGFRKEFGLALFQQLFKSTFDHKWRRVPGRVKTRELESFRDLTREQE